MKSMIAAALLSIALLPSAALGAAAQDAASARPANASDQDYRRDVWSDLATYESDLTVFKRSAGNMSDEAKAETERILSAFESLLATAKAQYVGLAKAKGNDVKKRKKDLDETMTRLDDQHKALKSRFEEM